MSQHTMNVLWPITSYSMPNSDGTTRTRWSFHEISNLMKKGALALKKMLYAMLYAIAQGGYAWLVQYILAHL